MNNTYTYFNAQIDLSSHNCMEMEKSMISNDTINLYKLQFLIICRHFFLLQFVTDLTLITLIIHIKSTYMFHTI